MNGTQKNDNLNSMLHATQKLCWKYSVFFCLLSVLPWSAGTLSAATVYFNSNSNLISSGDTAVISVYLDTEGQHINVVEGEIAIQSKKTQPEVRELSVAGSDLSFWSRKPSFSPDTQVISFVGGTPGGFVKKDVLLFKIVLTGKKVGDVVFVPQTFSAYSNDGEGTPISVSSEDFLFRIEEGDDSEPQDEWRQIISQDNTPPETLTATVGRDQSLFDGQLFLTIEGYDSASGIDHFEIKEGELDAVRTGPEYVLQNQNGDSLVIITAFDKAGNTRVFEFIPVKSYRNWWILGATVLVIGCVFLFFKMKRKTKKIV